MLKDIEIEELFSVLSLPELGRKLVRSAREFSPVREANSRLGNSIVWQFSQKMGNKHLELESRTVEAVAATLYEEDIRCLEFWPQPFKVELLIKDRTGRIASRNLHTPDFLIIKHDEIEIIY